MYFKHGTGPTNCGCDDQFDPITQSVDLTLWLMKSDDADIPVNGKVWMLLIAGVRIFLARERLAKKF